MYEKNGATLANINNSSHGEHLTLTVIVPVHNEEEALEEQTLKLVAYVRRLTDEFEVLLVENGSTDATSQIAARLERRYNVVRTKKLEKADYSTAVIEGIKSAKGRYSIVTGIDYVDLTVLDRCMRALKRSDIVICSKNRGVDRRAFMSRFANRCYNASVKLFFGLRHSDIEGYHGYNTSKIQPLVSDIRTRAHLGNLWVLLKARRAGLKIAEVPFIVYERRRSKFMSVSRLPYLATISLIEFIKLKCKGY